MNNLTVIKWTFWDDPAYDEAEWTDDATDRSRDLAVVEALKEHGYRFNGTDHQHYRFGTPVLSDGRKYTVSMRHWGSLIAAALGDFDSFGYAAWAWTYSKDEKIVYPQPSDWEESEESLQAQKERWKTHKRQTEAME